MCLHRFFSLPAGTPKGIQEELKEHLALAYLERSRAVLDSVPVGLPTDLFLKKFVTGDPELVRPHRYPP